MSLTWLFLVFAVVVAGIWLKKPLFVSLGAGVVAAILLYRVPFGALPGILLRGLTGKATLNTLFSFYAITFLQRMLQKRERLLQAEQAIMRINNNRRVNLMLTPFVIGMMPSVGAVLIAAPIVDRLAGESLDVPGRAFVTSFYRHISEAFLPTYATILLAMNLSGTAPTAFVLAMLPLVMALFFLGYWFYLRRVPRKEEGAQDKGNRKGAALELVKSLWTIVVSVALILMFNAPVYLVVLGVILLNAVLDRFTPRELLPMFQSAFETKLMVNTVIIMIFKEVLEYTGVLIQLPQAFAALPFPYELLLAFTMFVGTVVSGHQTMVAVLIPLAFAAPGAGLPLLVLLMSMNYAAAQVSPLHICLSVISEYHHITLGALVKKSVPVIGSFLLVAVGYYYVLKLFL